MLVEDQPVWYLVLWFVALPGEEKEESRNSYWNELNELRLKCSALVVILSPQAYGTQN